MRIDKTTIQTTKGPVAIFKITNATGASVALSSIGAGILSIIVPDKEGNLSDVVLGYKNIEDYFYDGPCAGKTPGRYANRLSKGHLGIDGVLYQLNINNGPNALHGGPEGFANKVWQGEQDGDKVVFNYNSPDGEENYPGELTAKISYHWTDENKLYIEYRATTTKKTVVNLTNHTYFNLNGEASGTVLNHKLKLNSSKYLPTDATLIPTGQLESVSGTPMDFSTEKLLGKEINCDFNALKFGKGYDNCWVLDNWEKGKTLHAATLTSDESGRVLNVYTSQPGVQVYTGNWLKGCPISKSEKEYNDYDGVAIECQAFPDSPNNPAFPDTTLDVGHTYSQQIIFEFSNQE